ncbi:hypothetical protein [Luteolibacter soli]|uniref:Uncharacterized protein n=1 Tax=Luteolibacter soli TaxID=3135280 RepID=A0ABU9AVU5_9BACT
MRAMLKVATPGDPAVSGMERVDGVMNPESALSGLELVRRISSILSVSFAAGPQGRLSAAHEL